MSKFSISTQKPTSVPTPTKSTTIMTKPPNTTLGLSSEEVQVAAIEEVKHLLNTPEQLTRITQLHTQTEQYIHTLTTNIDTLIQQQISNIVQGIQLLLCNQQQLHQLRVNFVEMYQYCQHTHTMFNDSDATFIEYICLVQQNLDATLSLLNRFSTLPTQVDELLDLMNEDHAIKDVYKQLRHLVILRDNAIKQLQVRIQQSTHTQGSTTLSQEIDFVKQLEERFDILEQVSTSIEARILENIEDSAYENGIAVDDPTTLIRTLEVCVMEDKAKRKVLGKGVLRSGANAVTTSTANKPSKTNSTSQLTMQEKVFNILETVIAKRFSDQNKTEAEVKASKDDVAAAAAATPRHNDDAATNKRSDYVITVLNDLNSYVDELIKLIAETEPCYPPDYHIREFFEERFRHWMLFTIQYHTTDIVSLSKKALLKAVQWISRYQQQMLDFTPNDAETVALRKILKTCMYEYTRSTEATLNTLVTNIVTAEEQSAVAERDADGQYVTTGPSDLFYTISQQIDIVINTYQLQGYALSYIVLMVADVVTNYQNLLLKFMSNVVRRGDLEEDEHNVLTPDNSNDLLFGEQHTHKDDTYFIAIINNSEQCIENMDEIKERCMVRFDDTSTIVIDHTSKSVDALNSSASQVSMYAKMRDTFDECADGFVSVSTEAVDILVLIMVTTCSAPLQYLYTQTWLDTPQHTSDLVTTIKDYITDYKQWIKQMAYVIKLLRSLLHTLVGEYIRRLLTSKFTTEPLFLHRLQQDIEMLDSTFSAYTFFPRKHVEEEISVLTLICDLLGAEVDYIAMHFSALLNHFGGLSYELLETLLQSRSDVSRSRRKALIEELREVQRMQDEARALGQRGSGVANPVTQFVNVLTSGSEQLFTHMHAASSVFEKFVAKHSGKKKTKLKASAKIEKRFVNDDEEVLNLTSFLAPDVQTPQGR